MDLKEICKDCALDKCKESFCPYMVSVHSILGKIREAYDYGYCEGNNNGYKQGLKEKDVRDNV